MRRGCPPRGSQHALFPAGGRRQAEQRGDGRGDVGQTELALLERMLHTRIIDDEGDGVQAVGRADGRLALLRFEHLVGVAAEASSGSSKLRLGAMNPLFIIKVE